jgi:hypothetical protein
MAVKKFSGVIVAGPVGQEHPVGGHQTRSYFTVENEGGDRI